MTTYLVVELYGPAVAFGATAVGRQRPIFDHLSKSGFLGLCCAALGIRDDQPDQIRAFHAGYGFASSIERQGALYTDYQTVRSQDEDHSFLSYRDYRAGALFMACVWALPSAPISLQEIAAAMKRPRYHLYLGRKCCPLGFPLVPQFIEAEYPTNAIRQAEMPGAKFLGLTLDATRTLRWEGPGGSREQEQLTRDSLAYQGPGKWHHQIRPEAVATEAREPSSA